MAGLLRIPGLREVSPTLARVAKTASVRLFGLATKKRPHVANVGRLGRRFVD